MIIYIVKTLRNTALWKRRIFIS